MTTRFHIGEFHFSAYLKSSFITKLHGEAQLDLAEMNPLLNACVEEAQQDVKAYFRDRAAERARTVVEEWKAEKVYPYEGEAKSALEDAERQGVRHTGRDGERLHARLRECATEEEGV